MSTEILKNWLDSIEDLLALLPTLTSRKQQARILTSIEKQLAEVSALIEEMEDGEQD